MEEPTGPKKAFADLLIYILKDRKDLADQIEDCQFDAAIGKFVREFEHIKIDMLSFICKCFISQGLNETNDMMVRYLLKDMKLGNIRCHLVPLYKFVNPVDKTGHKGLEKFSQNIEKFISNRNNLIHDTHFELGHTMKDTGKKVTGHLSISAKLSPEGPTAKAVIYKTSEIEKSIQYVKELQHWLKQCCERIATQRAISNLLNEFNKKRVPSMGNTMSIPP